MGPGASALDSSTESCVVFPCICVWLHRTEQLRLHPEGSLSSHVIGSSEVGLAPRLLGDNPAVCFFTSSLWSRSFRQVPSQKSRDAARLREQQIPSFSHPG